jgi:hypothetical protein
MYRIILFVCMDFDQSNTSKRVSPFAVFPMDILSGNDRFDVFDPYHKIKIHRVMNIGQGDISLNIMKSSDGHRSSSDSV